MPVYNGEKFLTQSIDSILNSSYKNFELIVVNDGSTDSSESIVKSYKDKRIKIFSLFTSNFNIFFFNIKILFFRH